MRNIIIIWVIVICLLLPQNVFSITSSQGITIADNFPSLVHFNKKLFTWTDAVNITVYAPDFNSDPNAIDEIGVTSDDKVTISTTGHSIPYRLVETGTDTGIFGGYITLTGDPTQKGSTGVDGRGTNPQGIESNCNPICGPTDGFLPSTGNDGVTVSFEYSRDQTVTGSALIQWNIGKITWLQPNYALDGQGVVQITDPDMNLNPKVVDSFDTNVSSGSDSSGIKLKMVETGDSTGIFEGTVFFSNDLASSGSRLHVSNGDVVSAEYVDRTLPTPHSPSDQLRITATTSIGSTIPPLGQVLARDARILDSMNLPVTKVMTNHQIQIVSDLTNQQDINQPFAYLVQVQDNNGITLSLTWVSGSMSPKQTLNLSQSWIPKNNGTYTAQIFVWESLTNPNALSPPLSLPINVS